MGKIDNKKILPKERKNLEGFEMKIPKKTLHEKHDDAQQSS